MRDERADPGPTLESILGWGQGQDPSCLAQVRIVTIPRCHPLTVWPGVCHSTRNNFFRGNPKRKPFRVRGINHCKLFYDCHLSSSLSAPNINIKNFYHVDICPSMGEGWWLRVTGCMQAQDLDTASLPVRGWGPAWARAASTIWRLRAVRAGPVFLEAGCNETYTRLTHPTLGKTMTSNTQDQIQNDKSA